MDNIQNLVSAVLGIEDALREAAQSVRLAGSRRKSGNDYRRFKNTAKTIAKEAGIYADGDLIITGPELAELTLTQLKKNYQGFGFSGYPGRQNENYRRLSVFGTDCGYDRRRVNDAPSLVTADLGVAMGKIGTEVAKAADIVCWTTTWEVLLRLLKGRVMYVNIKKALQFLFSTSFGELLTVVFSLFCACRCR